MRTFLLFWNRPTIEYWTTTRIFKLKLFIHTILLKHHITSNLETSDETVLRKIERVRKEPSCSEKLKDSKRTCMVRDNRNTKSWYFVNPQNNPLILIFPTITISYLRIRACRATRYRLLSIRYYHSKIYTTASKDVLRDSWRRRSSELPCSHEFHVLWPHSATSYKFYSKEPHECQSNNRRSNINEDKLIGNRNAYLHICTNTFILTHTGFALAVLKIYCWFIEWFEFNGMSMRCKKQ